MNLFTVGFTKKTAKQFFELIKSNRIDMLLDIRRTNNSQLAGFSKSTDLEYFLSEICGCDYKHCPEYAPTQEMFEGHRSNALSWENFKTQFEALLRKRGDYWRFTEQYGVYENVCLLCSEPEPGHCHRSIVAELIRECNPQVVIKHL